MEGGLLVLKELKLLKRANVLTRGLRLRQAKRRSLKRWLLRGKVLYVGVGIQLAQQNIVLLWDWMVMVCVRRPRP